MKHEKFQKLVLLSMWIDFYYVDVFITGKMSQAVQLIKTKKLLIE